MVGRVLGAPCFADTRPKSARVSLKLNGRSQGQLGTPYCVGKRSANGRLRKRHILVGVRRGPVNIVGHRGTESVERMREGGKVTTEKQTTGHDRDGHIGGAHLAAYTSVKRGCGIIMRCVKRRLKGIYHKNSFHVSSASNGWPGLQI